MGDKWLPQISGGRATNHIKRHELFSSFPLWILFLWRLLVESQIKATKEEITENDKLTLHGRDESAMGLELVRAIHGGPAMGDREKSIIS
ncbi:hypothetical protein HanPSC8_Chr13g0594371 [Helianthus annuus]|nr:hypothetical protein HanPSC8_Chr13g0594371 [Helianthus annuus]